MPYIVCVIFTLRKEGYEVPSIVDTPLLFLSKCRRFKPQEAGVCEYLSFCSDHYHLPTKGKIKSTKKKTTKKMKRTSVSSVLLLL